MQVGKMDFASLKRDLIKKIKKKKGGGVTVASCCCEFHCCVYWMLTLFCNAISYQAGINCSV